MFFENHSRYNTVLVELVLKPCIDFDMLKIDAVLGLMEAKIY